METGDLSSKLAVIVHADVAGSTSLVQKDEAAAHRRIRAMFQDFAQCIEAHGGIAREIRGDALLAEFDRASDAVSAATAFQSKNQAAIRQSDEDIDVQLRIGISLGEVIIADNTITGAGVVLAQRLEQLAEPGEVVVQGSIVDTVPDRFAFDFEDLGQQILKGFEQPVRAAVARAQAAPKSADKTRRAADDADRKEQPGARKPSIAVLPFTNMSADPEQEFFSDGITEDIITELSRISGLIVIARNSTFIYKGKAVDIRTVGADLDVRYVLEGSVRRSGDRVRVTAQLIDASNGQHLWAERYDRELEDIFGMQDDIMREIVSALDVEILAGEQSRFWSDGTDNLKAWEYQRRARDLLGLNKSENHAEVIRLARKALEFDPGYSAAWQILAALYFHIEDDTAYSDEERGEAEILSKQYMQKAIECDPSNPNAHSLQALHHLSAKEFDEAFASTNQAVAIAPNHAHVVASSAIVITKCGFPEIGLQRIRKAMKLCPVYPLWYLVTLGQTCRILGMVDEATQAFEKMVEFDPDQIEGHLGLAGIHAQAGNNEQAAISAAEVMRLNPHFSVDRYFDNIAFRDASIIARFREALRLAGLPG